jgi:hypothetical protein
MLGLNSGLTLARQMFYNLNHSTRPGVVWSFSLKIPLEAAFFSGSLLTSALSHSSVISDPSFLVWVVSISSSLRHSLAQTGQVPDHTLHLSLEGHYNCHVCHPVEAPATAKPTGTGSHQNKV